MIALFLKSGTVSSVKMHQYLTYLHPARFKKMKEKPFGNAQDVCICQERGTKADKKIFLCENFYEYFVSSSKGELVSCEPAPTLYGHNL